MKRQPNYHTAVVRAVDKETATAAGEFTQLARLLVRSKGDVLQAERTAESQRVNGRVLDVIQRGAVTPGGISTWGSSIAQYDELSTAFLQSLAHVSAFDTMLPNMRQIPLRTRVVLVTSGITGAEIGEFSATPISSLSLTSDTTDLKKGSAQIIVSDELARLSSGGGNLFARELRTALAIVTDQQFVATLSEGLTPTSSSGGTAVALADDISAALDQIETSAASRLYILVTSTIAKRWSTMTDSAGARALPDMGPGGGSAFGIPVVVTDGLDAGEVLVVDASQIAAGAGTIELDVSTEAAVQLDTAPTSPPTGSTVPFSLWAHNCTALKATRYFTATRLNSSAAALIASAVYSPQ